MNSYWNGPIRIEGQPLTLLHQVGLQLLQMLQLLLELVLNRVLWIAWHRLRLPRVGLFLNGCHFRDLILHVLSDNVRGLRRPFRLQLLLKLSHHFLLRLQCARPTTNSLLHLLQLDCRLARAFDLLPSAVGHARLSTPESHPSRPAFSLFRSVLGLALNSSVDGLHFLRWTQPVWLLGGRLGVRALAYWRLSVALLDHLLQVRH